MLLKDRLHQLFTTYDMDVQLVIAEVLTLEQQNISQMKPRLKDQINEIITNVVEKEAVKLTRKRSLEQ